MRLLIWRLGKLQGPAGRDQSVNNALLLHPCVQLTILLHPNWDALIVQ